MSEGTTAPVIDVDELVADLRERVARRRVAGDYPPGLERQLEAEFDVILDQMHRHDSGETALADRVGEAGWAAHNVHAGSASSSRIPGGAVLHGAVGRLVGRHTHELTDSVRRYAVAAQQALVEVERSFRAQRRADERELNEVLGAVLDRLAVIDHLAEAVVDIESRLDRLERSAATGSISADTT